MEIAIFSILIGLKMPPLAPQGYKVYHYTTNLLYNDQPYMSRILQLTIHG